MLLSACAITSETLVGTLGPVLDAIFFPSILGAKVKEMCSNNPSLRGVLYSYIKLPLSFLFFQNCSS